MRYLKTYNESHKKLTIEEIEDATKCLADLLQDIFDKFDIHYYDEEKDENKYTETGRPYKLPPPTPYWVFMKHSLGNGTYVFDTIGVYQISPELRGLFMEELADDAQRIQDTIGNGTIDFSFMDNTIWYSESPSHIGYKSISIKFKFR